jgi:transcriptional regulator with XRE-family HTH domain
MAQVTQEAMQPTPIELFIILRKRKDWSREEAAEKLSKKAKHHVTARALRTWEEGSRSPKPFILDAIKEIVAAA